ncbi:MAG TPA: glycosyltransferase family 39 protein [Candidatus Paceibacterota bacterium]|nr:glycosyltransferase family 39 protein [Candidatus Paceibacterota bacterium]
MMFTAPSSKTLSVVLAAVLGAALFLSVFRLTESPAVWYDEGLIVQPALNVAKYGEYSVQTAPGKFISPSFISVGYPVLYPLAAVFGLFGFGVLQARLVMAFFLMAFFASAFFYLRKNSNRWAVVWGLLLLASFAPLYGNGKGVLGEVPGLSFLACSLVFLRSSNKGAKWSWLVSGLFAGLCVATKPIFILFIGALGLSFLLNWKKELFSLKDLALFVAGFFLPFAVWLFTQISGSDSGSAMLRWYLNPYSLADLGVVALANMARFLTEAAPAYTAALMTVWAASLWIRKKRTEKIEIAEQAAFIFAVLILGFYLRTPGWYRYFFPAQVVALLHMPTAGSAIVEYAGNFRRKFGIALGAVGVALIGFQFYQVGFDSWAAGHYANTRTAELSAYFAAIPPGAGVFLYNVPELSYFIGDRPYFQYLELTPAMARGEDQLAAIQQRQPDLIIIRSAAFAERAGQFPGYREREKFDSYTLLEKRP